MIYQLLKLDGGWWDIAGYAAMLVVTAVGSLLAKTAGGQWGPYCLS